MPKLEKWRLENRKNLEKRQIMEKEQQESLECVRKNFLDKRIKKNFRKLKGFLKDGVKWQNKKEELQKILEKQKRIDSRTIRRKRLDKKY